MQLLNQLLARLIKSEVEFVLVGGLAAAIHGSSLNTRDVDVCIDLTEANLRRLHGAIEDLHPVHRSRPDLPFVVSAEESICEDGLRYLGLSWRSAWCGEL